jgi:hypothetical protein
MSDARMGSEGGGTVTHSKPPPNEAAVWLRRGLRAVQAGDLTRARRRFQVACLVDPRNVVALLWLAWLAPSREESLALLVQVLEIDPRNEHAHAGIRWARHRPSLSELEPPAPADPCGGLDTRAIDEE